MNKTICVFFGFLPFSGSRDCGQPFTLLVYISGIGGFSPVFTAALAVAFPVSL
jgi:hypothetical protein